MPKPTSPYSRSIGLVGIVRMLSIAVALMAAGAAFSQGRTVMGVVVLLFVALASVFAVLAARARGITLTDTKPRPPV